MTAAPARVWRLLVSPAASGAENMALDEALMERAREAGEWVLRVYAWATPTMSLGRNQTARDRYRLDALRDAGIEIVRRPTGGRAILHDREITYSVTAPANDAGELLQSYAGINGLLLRALSSMGVSASVATSTRRGMVPSMLPCFNEPSTGELTAEGRKLAGSAQWRSDGALLQHGSILIADDQSRLAAFTVEPGPPIPAPATLSSLLGRAPSVAEVAGALAAAVEAEYGEFPRELEVDEPLRARTSALVVRYLDDAWTWRR